MSALMVDDAEYRDLAEKLKDPMFRLRTIYKIMTKGDDGQPSVIQFVPNEDQMRFIKRLWHRNIILKCRQRGFTTLICILWLDHALFNANQRCGVIAQDLEAASAIFRDKVKFAYENLPESLRQAFPLARDSASELLFAHNNSSVRVATSMRSGTIHRLLISEFGKICAKFPDKAKEVTTGSLPAVPKSGIAVIESTAEGQEGDFFDMCTTARADAEQGKTLTAKDYRFHFFPWWRAKEYSIPSSGVIITQKDNDYFDAVEVAEGVEISMNQRAWYVTTRRADFAGDDEKMWQEYPSTADEAFQKSTEGTYYATQIMAARRESRITKVPYVAGQPVHTFWDIGHGDGTAIWLMQRIGLRNQFIGFIEGWGEPYAFYVAELQKRGYVWGTHYLPHDGNHVRQGALRNLSPKQMLGELGLQNIEIVPVVSDLQQGIQATRDFFGSCWFDEEKCAEGIIHLQSYKKRWNSAAGCWSDLPLKDIHTEGADSFRQAAQGFDPEKDGKKPLVLNFRSQFSHGR